MPAERGTDAPALGLHSAADCTALLRAVLARAPALIAAVKNGNAPSMADDYAKCRLDCEQAAALNCTVNQKSINRGQEKSYEVFCLEVLDK